MAVVNGSYKIKVVEFHISRSNPVPYGASYQIVIQDRNAVDVIIGGGTKTGNFGTPTAWRAMTGLQMENQVLADITADPKTPPNDSIS